MSWKLLGYGRPARYALFSGSSSMSYSSTSRAQSVASHDICQMQVKLKTWSNMRTRTATKFARVRAVNGSYMSIVCTRK